MKNIHVLPTDKPSRLYKNINNELSFTDVEFEQKINGFNINQNIYITSDSDLDINDWVTDGKDIWQVSYILADNIQQAKKIILTTDQDLIKDGVQPIDDEFLEWFVKNPSCEEVGVNELRFFNPDTNESAHCKWELDIPKEEPKQYSKVLSENGIELFFDEQGYLLKEEPDYTALLQPVGTRKERSYSEEDMHNLMDEYQDYLFKTNDPVKTFKKWFEQFKKK